MAPGEVFGFLGHNGAGKTTSIGKLAHYFQQQGLSVMLAAGDTFRAAAVEQLQVWGDRAGVPVLTAPEGSDPDSLAFVLMMVELDGCLKCNSNNYKFLRGCYLCATQTAGTDDFYAQGAKAHCRRDTAFHGPPKRHPSFNLKRYIFGNQLCINFRFTDFLDID